MLHVQWLLVSNMLYRCLFQAENIYNDEEPDAPAGDLEQAST